MRIIEPNKRLGKDLIGFMIASTATIGSIIPVTHVIPFFVVSIIVVVVGCFEKLYQYPILKFVIENIMVVYNMVFFSILIAGLINITLIIIGEIF